MLKIFNLETMKKSLLFLIPVFFVFIVSSCKKETSTETKEETSKDINFKENFTVEFDVISLIQDDFAVYYTEDKTINFTADKAIWRGVKAQPESQKVIIEFPEEILPTNIRFDFGINENQGDIILEKFKISYYGKSFEAKGSEFFNYFVKNEAINTKIDEANGTITFLKNKEKFTTPYFYPNQPILDEIVKITN